MMSGAICLLIVVWQMTVTLVLAQTSEKVSIPIEGQRAVSGEIWLPSGGGTAPAVLVLHTAIGYVESFDSAFARALAEAGFVALAVNYGSREDRRREGWREANEKALLAVAHWLRSRREVGGKPLGVVGFSLGARGLILAASDPDIKAVVVYYGSYDTRSRNPNLPPEVRTPIDTAVQISAAVLLLHGEADDEIPLNEAQAMKAALQRAGKTVALITYPGAYHRFDRGRAVGARSDRSPQGYTYRKDDAATKDALQRTIGWLKKHLGS